MKTRLVSVLNHFLTKSKVHYKKYESHKLNYFEGSEI